MNSVELIEMFAGNDPNGQPVVEKLVVRPDSDQGYQLIKSPAFVRGLASGDRIKFNRESNQFELDQRSGNLCIRVYCRDEAKAVSESLTPPFEQLGGELDIETPRMLVYTIHVSCGFQTIESLLNEHVKDDALWTYGNVYAEDGQTPLNWWNDLLKPQ